ncbi:MAG: phosphoribosyltransferase [Bacteroidales bacterium]
MPDKVTIFDKTFKKFIDYKDINSAIQRIACGMNDDLKDEKPLFIAVLNGAFMFASDVFKEINIEGAEISFVKFSSYEGDSSSGNIKKLIGFNEDIKGRTLVILEDIIDTGNTLAQIGKQLEELGVKKVITATMLFKPEALKNDINIDYIGLEIPDRFIVGYGLDYNGLGRNFKHIYQLC